MKFIHKDQKIFYQNNEGNELAYLQYSISDDGKVLNADATFVDPSLRGQGVARQLVDALATYAREHSLKIKPICSYVVHLFDTVDDYQDIAL
ncbi:GNAT family N-acetyltransferase [Allofustis seminis]|uniref:GNAT family N-acetyltransferase n=1 Tax=Allofustis seminis TaxID=166939 RepID=UPI00038050DA|nr:GNAT family N-acetyltransferase [Allofustis seminis]